MRCCLVWYEQYVELWKSCETRKLVVTPKEKRKSRGCDPVEGDVIVVEQGGLHEFMLQDIQPLDELDALNKKAENSCESCPEDARMGMSNVKKKPHGRRR
jgi:hypothetical protein